MSNTKENMKVWEKFEAYTSQPLTEKPLLDQIEPATLMGWFRCNSCYTCKWRTDVIDKDPDPHHDIHWCSRMHDKFNIIDMVSYLGYSKEGREMDTYPRYGEKPEDE